MLLSIVHKHHQQLFIGYFKLFIEKIIQIKANLTLYDGQLKQVGLDCSYEVLTAI